MTLLDHCFCGVAVAGARVAWVEADVRGEEVEVVSTDAPQLTMGSWPDKLIVN